MLALDEGGLGRKYRLSERIWREGFCGTCIWSGPSGLPFGLFTLGCVGQGWACGLEGLRCGLHKHHQISCWRLARVEPTTNIAGIFWLEQEPGNAMRFGLKGEIANRQVCQMQVRYTNVEHKNKLVERNLTSIKFTLWPCRVVMHEPVFQPMNHQQVTQVQW